jgi:hypothetical protein
MQFLKTCLIVGIGSLAFAASTTTAQDDITAIKAEITELRKELATVRKERDELRKELASLKGDQALKNAKTPQAPEGEINGIVWEISFLAPDGKALGSGQFLALDGKIYGKSAEIGTYTESGFRATIEITRAPGGLEAFNGTYNFLRITNNPPSYKGTFITKQGIKTPVSLRAVKD